MIRINIFYNEGTAVNGKKYKVPHTLDFGYDMTVSLNGNARSLVQYDQNLNTYYIVYDPLKAGVKINNSGYLTLHISD